MCNILLNPLFIIDLLIICPFNKINRFFFFLLGKVFYEIHRSLITFYYIEYIGINVYIFHDNCENFMNFICNVYFILLLVCIKLCQNLTNVRMLRRVHATKKIMIGSANNQSEMNKTY